VSGLRRQDSDRAHRPLLIAVFARPARR